VLSCFLAADALCALASKGPAQCQHKLVAGPQRVGQHGRHRAGLAERGGDDKNVVSTRLLPGGQQDAAASGRIGSGLQAGDPVLAEQGVVVVHHPGHGDDGAAQCHDLRQGGFAHRGHAQADLVGRGAGRGRGQPRGVGVVGVGHPQPAGGGVHLGGERSLAAGVPAGEDPRHVVR